MDQPFGDNERLPLTEEATSSIMQSSAKYVRNRFYGYTELEDILQVLRLDMLEHPIKYNKLIQAGSADFLFKEYTRVGSRYAMKDKAAALGFRPEDLFYYSKKVLREIIPVIIESWRSGDKYEFEYSDRALWMDVEGALKKLTASEWQIICWAFEGDDDTVAAKLGISEGAASMRVSRLLDKIREGLGGENPAPRRRSLSNAASQAMTRNQWDGEG